MDKNKEALMAFYNKALTVNTATTPTAVLSEVLADDFTSYGSVDSKGKPALMGQVEFFWKLIPDLKWEPQDIANDGDKYVVRSLVSGTPNGDFMGTPTDGTKSFKIMSIDFHTVIDGKLTSVHHLEDWGTAMKQLKG
ncbi:ester cyclase [Chryseobacterium binzhouense]|uniref:ester cyclase n=1 Tax=Chryseobacterium binzhouense TaxID=2593646 RepID=UPI00289E123F|nr:ester cyclase [Chryseobacterium binzhouense]